MFEDLCGGVILSAKTKNKSVFPRIYSTPEQTTAVRTRIRAAATSGFWEHFPEYRRAVDALPDLEPLFICVMELRPTVLDAYMKVGVEVPREVWEALGIGQFAPRSTK